MGFEFVNRGHLGGYIRSTAEYPNGDPATYCPALWDWLCEKYKPEKVFDVGCGEGHAVRYFSEKPGVFAIGIDGCQEVLQTKVKEICLLLHDYTEGPLPVSVLMPEFTGTLDLIWCCEFVEHIEEKYAENFLQTFDLAKVVAMTHAFPGQPGHHHCNCQPPDYWIDLMAKRGFYCDGKLSFESRLLVPGTHWERSGLIFTKDGPSYGKSQ